jgi:hypothetical protein
LQRSGCCLPHFGFRLCVCGFRIVKGRLQWGGCGFRSCLLRLLFAALQALAHPFAHAWLVTHPQACGQHDEPTRLANPRVGRRSQLSLWLWKADTRSPPAQNRLTRFLSSFAIFRLGKRNYGGKMAFDPKRVQKPSGEKSKSRLCSDLRRGFFGPSESSRACGTK